MKHIPLTPRPRGGFTEQFGLFVFFLLFPALFTALVPRYTVDLVSDESGVTAEVTAHTLLFIPYWRQRESGVVSIDVEIDAGERVPYDPQQSVAMNQLHRRARTVDSATVHFRGNGEGAGFAIEAARLEEVLPRFQSALADPAQLPLHQSFWAQRALGLYVGGFLTGLVVLIYLPLLMLTLIRLVLRRPYWPFEGFRGDVEEFRRRRHP